MIFGFKTTTSQNWPRKLLASIICEEKINKKNGLFKITKHNIHFSTSKSFKLCG
jgi:hypothetical protein